MLEQTQPLLAVALHVHACASTRPEVYGTPVACPVDCGRGRTHEASAWLVRWSDEDGGGSFFVGRLSTVNPVIPLNRAGGLFNDLSKVFR